MAATSCHAQAEVLRKFLQHHGHALRTPARRALPQRLAVQFDLATARPLEAIGAAQQAGLAAAVGADQPQQLAIADVQVDALEQRHAGRRATRPAPAIRKRGVIRSCNPR